MIGDQRDAAIAEAHERAIQTIPTFNRLAQLVEARLRGLRLGVGGSSIAAHLSLLRAGQVGCTTRLLLEPLGLGQRLAGTDNIGLDHLKRDLRLATSRLAIANTVGQFCATERGSGGSFAVFGCLCLCARETPLVLCLGSSRLERGRERRLGGLRGGCEAILDTGVVGVGR